MDYIQSSMEFYRDPIGTSIGILQGLFKDSMRNPIGILQGFYREFHIHSKGILSISNVIGF
jgi:hypothetical protein